MLSEVLLLNMYGIYGKCFGIILREIVRTEMCSYGKVCIFSYETKPNVK